MAKLMQIVAICVLSTALSHAAYDKEEAMKDFMAKMESCKGEVGATETDMDDLVKQVAASSKQGKCFRACLMKTYGVMDDSGKFVKSVAMKHAEEFTSGDADKLKTSNEMIEVCANVAVPDDHCEAAEALGKCFVEQGKAHGIDKFKFEGL